MLEQFASERRGRSLARRPLEEIGDEKEELMVRVSHFEMKRGFKAMTISDTIQDQFYE